VSESWKALAVALLSIVACDKQDALSHPQLPVPAQDSTAMNRSHGIRVGDRMAAFELPCADERHRGVSPSHGRQLVTFVTARDCLDCQLHLTGLDSLHHAAQGLPAHILVAYAASGEQRATVRTIVSQTSLPVCVDAGGALWDRLDIANTPFTVLLSDQRVVYLNDLPLDTPDRVALLRRALMELGALAR